MFPFSILSDSSTSIERCPGVSLDLGLAVGTILIVDLNLNLDLDLRIGFEIDVAGVVNIFFSY